MITLLISTVLGCQTLTGIQEDVRDARKTARVIETELEKLATRVKGLATSVEESGALETAVVFATEQGGALVATDQAMGTWVAERGIRETVEAFVTKEGNEALCGVSLAPARPC